MSGREHITRYVNILSGNRSPCKDQYKVLLNRRGSPMGSDGDFIEIINEGDNHELIARLGYDKNLSINEMAIHNFTHARTLFVGNHDLVKYRIIENKNIKRISNISVHCVKTDKVINNPPLPCGIYVEPGYIISIPSLGLGTVKTGKGFYQYKKGSINDDLDLFETDDPIEIEEDHVEEESSVNVNFNEMGIGGLSSQMETIIKQVLISRIIDKKMLNVYHVKHVKGMLLYGPPGTGKTTIAKNIGKIIPNSKITKINGPELNSKFHGESESNVREIFGKSKEKPDELHIIIFDEIDAIGKKRGNDTFGDKTLTQLLTMIDGMDTTDNILVIGITNRKDVLDPALIRAGRLECHVEIPLPDEKGRKEILNIFLNPLVKDNILKKENINLDKLAKDLDGYSGSDIESLVTRVKNLALLRNCDIDKHSIKPIRNIKTYSNITSVDFDIVLENFQPTFTNKHEFVKRCIDNVEIDKHMKDRLEHYYNIFSEINNKNIYNTPIVINIDPNLDFEGKNDPTFSRNLSCLLSQKIAPVYVSYLSYNDFLGLDSFICCKLLDEHYFKCLQGEYSVLILDSLDQLYNNNIMLKQRYIMESPLESGKRLVVISITSKV